MNSTTEAQQSNIKESLSSLCNALREKYWEELSIEEKIERTRQMTKRLTENLLRENENLRHRNSELEFRFLNHSHVEGEIMYKHIRQQQVIGEQCFSTKQSDKDKYF